MQLVFVLGRFSCARQVREGQVGLLAKKAEWRLEDEGERYVSVSLSQSDMQRTLLFTRAAKRLTAKKKTKKNKNNM